MKENFLFNIMNSLCLCVVMSIELLNKIEDFFALRYAQPLNENILKDLMMLLDASSDAHFNGVSTEIFFGCIFKSNVLGFTSHERERISQICTIICIYWTRVKLWIKEWKFN